MKNIMKVGAFAVAMFTAVSCSENETDIPQPGNNDGQVALGVTTNLKVDAGTKAATRSVVVGTKITYNESNYANNDSVPGIGIAILNKTKNAWYTPDGTNHTAYGTSHQVWFVGDKAGANWLSILAKNATYADQEETPFYLKKEVGCVYAYYPYDATAFTSVTPSSETDMKVPANLLATGAIDAQYANNAAMKWDDGTTKWVSNGSTSSATRKQKIASLDEKDYMYHDATVAAGRYVNNGHADGYPVVKPEADADNSNENNPGWKIGLSMNHALAMVSFRVYDGGKLSNDNVTFKSFVIKNHASVTNFLGTGTMSLVDGTITTTGSSATITRNISNYILKRQVETGESEHAFIATGTGLNAVSGKTVSKAVGALVYPLSFNENEIDVTVTLNDGANDMVFTVVLPAIEWLAGNNYIYTLMAGKNKLDVISVDVTDWVDEEITDEIPL
ncbi:fimbrillin family protein [Parabacteroides bouchesdurhonensis]|uniref:fimbrillin family protein n=1 Tax=Parabacteroides bouchesdurhonensis TaxID=1936995 RepID=UPI001D0CDABB|nr:hypothetical protein [Parabacteroides bouchesdurhonensis]